MSQTCEHCRQQSQLIPSLLLLCLRVQSWGRFLRSMTKPTVSNTEGQLKQNIQNAKYYAKAF